MISESIPRSQALDSNMVESLVGLGLPNSWSTFSMKSNLATMPPNVLAALGFISISSSVLIYVGTNAAPLFLRFRPETTISAPPILDLPPVTIEGLMTTVHPVTSPVRRATRSVAEGFWSGNVHPDADALPPTFPFSEPPVNEVANTVPFPTSPDSAISDPPGIAELFPSLTRSTPATPWNTEVHPDTPFSAVSAPSAKRPRTVDYFDDMETALTFRSVDFRSFWQVNEHLLHMSVTPPNPINLSLADPLEFLTDFLRVSTNLESFCYFSKAVVAVAKESPDRRAPEIAAAALGKDFFLRNPESASMATCSGDTLSDFLHDVYMKFIYPRVGPHCALRLQRFKEDRTLPLSSNQSTFLRLATSARDITVRAARKLYIDGIVDDEPARSLRAWLVNASLSRSHVSLETTLRRHHELCDAFDPLRSIPAQLAQVAAISNIEARPSAPVCWTCNVAGHVWRNCPSGRRPPRQNTHQSPFRRRGAPEFRISARDAPRFPRTDAATRPSAGESQSTEQ